MNVDAIPPSYTRHAVANQPRPGADSAGNAFEKARDDETPSRWDTTDTLELSPEYRSGERHPKIKDYPDYTAEDLVGIKKRFAALTSRRKGITSALQEILESTGSNLAPGDRIKVEIGSDGKALVGGVRDAELARKLEKTINADRNLIRGIKAFQKEETAVSQELRDVTGMSLNDFKTRISELQRGVAPEMIGGESAAYSAEERINLEDQELYRVDEELSGMISSYYKDANTQAGAYSADISGGNNILEHADETVKSVFKDILADVQLYIDSANETIRKNYQGDPEELEKLLLSLERVTIRADGAGNVSIEGAITELAATESKGSDQEYRDAFQEIFRENLKVNPQTGEKHDFYIASEYLENKYDLAFDGEDADRTLETVYRGGENGSIESHISSPEEEELREEITVEARAAMEDMGIEADSLDIQVADDGKLTVANMPPEGHERDMLEQALNMLNAATENRDNKDYNSMEENPGKPLHRLKGLMAKLDVFLPGGADVLNGLESQE